MNNFLHWFLFIYQTNQNKKKGKKSFNLVLTWNFKTTTKLAEYETSFTFLVCTSTTVGDLLGDEKGALVPGVTGLFTGLLTGLHVEVFTGLLLFWGGLRLMLKLIVLEVRLMNFGAVSLASFSFSAAIKTQNIFSHKDDLGRRVHNAVIIKRKCCFFVTKCSVC